MCFQKLACLRNFSFSILVFALYESLLYSHSMSGRNIGNQYLVFLSVFSAPNGCNGCIDIKFGLFFYIGRMYVVSNFGC